MLRDRLLHGAVLTAALMFSLAGCAGGKFRMDMAKSCQAHGGTWSASQETCSMSGSSASAASKQAKDICAAQGGDYLPGGTCMMEGVK